ncbi:MAG: acyltransferase [Bdellovibrionales bacterium]
MKTSLWRGLIAGGLFIANTLFFSVPILILAVAKAAIPLKVWRNWSTKKMVACGESWISVNAWNMSVTQNITWDIHGLEGLKRDGTYLVIANHQSWIDIVVLQYIFNRRIPFLRFFLKSQLFYLPIFGLVWWALDFPFMKRHSPEYLKRHPERRGQDMLTTKKTAERFRGHPVSILNFLEGTRFTVAKKERQNSPFRHLLAPKVGGMAFVLQAMGDQFTSILDVSICYPGQTINFGQALCGAWHKVVVKVRHIPVPQWALAGDYAEDREHRIRLQNWVRDIWQEKDQFLSQVTPG